MVTKSTQKVGEALKSRVFEGWEVHSEKGQHMPRQAKWKIGKGEGDNVYQALEHLLGTSGL